MKSPGLAVRKSVKREMSLKMCIVEAESRSTELFKGYDAKDVPKDALKAGDNL
jgi:hypothetical protein